MTSPLLALFARSLREDTRVKLTYLARTGLVLVILVFLFFTQSQMGWSGASGLRFFRAVVIINCCAILLAGLSHFASSITEEKEEMTLGLLRMTNLNPLSILLGKSTSRVFGALLLLAAQFPFTLIAVSLGGVSIGQIVACYCALGAFIVFLSNLALLASVIFRRTGAAATATGLILFGGFCIVPILNFFARLPRMMGATISDTAWVTWLNTLATWISQASPFNRLTGILGTGFNESPWCWQVASNLALGAGCFLLAWALFDLFCDEQPEAGPRRGAVARRTSGVRGAGRVWTRALAWKDFHFLAGGKAAIIVKCILYALPPVVAHFMVLSFNGTPDREVYGYTLIWCSLIFLFAEMAFASAKIFRIERQWKTLSSLLTLPMSIRQIAYQKILGCLPTLLPAFAYLVLGVALVADDIFRGITVMPASGLGAMLYLIVNWILDIALFLHLVAWLSLHMKRGALAVGGGIYIVAHIMVSMFLGVVFRGEFSFVPMTILLIVGIVVLHYRIGTRLQDLAAED